MNQKSEGLIARAPKATQAKRNRESIKQDRQRQKDQRRAERKEERDKRSPTEDGEDPDIAGIIPGPQPPLF